MNALMQDSEKGSAQFTYSSYMLRLSFIFAVCLLSFIEQ